MKLRRAHSVLHFKSFDESGEERIVEGIASTAQVDSYGDIVEPLGAEFELPMPLLWQHDHGKPVGVVEFAKPTKDGVPFRARIAKTDEEGTLKARLDEAWQSVKLGLVRAVSIGFRPLEWTQLKDGGYRFEKWKWVELSLVTIPANSEATIEAIRSVDRKLLAKSGKNQHTVKVPLAGASAEKHQTPEQRNQKMLKKQLEAAQAKRAANASRMAEIMKAAQEDGERTLDAAEAEEFDNLTAENDTLDAQIRRLNVAIKSAGETAVAVSGGTQEAASQARAGQIVSVKANLPKGARFARLAQAMVAAKGDLNGARAFAENRFGDTPEVATVLRAAVAAGTTTDPTWAGNLVEYRDIASEFIELLRPNTIFDKMTAVRRVPFRVKVPTQSAGSSASWVGEAAPKPVSALGFGQVQLDEHKVAGIVVISQELARSSNPNALDVIQRDLIKAVAQQIDLTMFDPAAAEVSGVSPASLTNGVVPVGSSGTNAAALRNDVQDLFNAFLGANQDISGLAWVMTPSQALAISMMLNPLGQPEFQGISAAGGTFFGLPVLVSNNLPVDTSGSIICLVNQQDILVADDGTVTLDVSTQASLQMDNAPAPGAQQLVSMFQNNLVAVRAERFLTWKKGRTTAVAYISGANYRA